MRPQEKILTSRGTTFRLKVESSNASADYRKYDDLRNDIWGFPEDNMAGPRNMMCENFLHEGSSLFIGRLCRETRPAGSPRTRDHLAGFSYGFVGVKDKSVWLSGRPIISGFIPNTRPSGRTIGATASASRIKEFQRDVVCSECSGIRPSSAPTIL